MNTRSLPDFGKKRPIFTRMMRDICFYRFLAILLAAIILPPVIQAESSSDTQTELSSDTQAESSDTQTELSSDTLEPEADGVVSSTDLTLTVSSRPEAKLTLTQIFTIPVLRGESFLTEANNLKIALSAEVSPISLNGAVDCTLTPIAFFQAAAGTRVGTGWNIRLFDNDIIGIGINQPQEDHGAAVDSSAFDGAFWKGHLGGVLQFDMAAIFPGDWHHVVIRSYHEINYKLFSRARGWDAWYYEADMGENQNGFNYYGNFLLGYQMPIFINTAALLVEVDKYLYDTPQGELWGDPLPRWYFAALVNGAITEQISAALIVQFRTMRRYTTGTQDYGHYRDRRMESPGALRLEFYRVAGIVSFHLR